MIAEDGSQRLLPVSGRHSLCCKRPGADAKHGGAAASRRDGEDAKENVSHVTTEELITPELKNSLIIIEWGQPTKKAVPPQHANCPLPIAARQPWG